ncbi:MAG: hypothetical protein ACRDH9_09270 [Actinomycetota bacterium]
MTTEHTPGPWWIDADEPGTEHQYLHISAGTPRKPQRIASMYFGEGRADARLIAAAPKMAEALKKLLSHGVPDGPGFMVDRECEEEAREALKEAGIE